MKCSVNKLHRDSCSLKFNIFIDGDQNARWPIFVTVVLLISMSTPLVQHQERDSVSGCNMPSLFGGVTLGTSCASYSALSHHAMANMPNLDRS